MIHRAHSNPAGICRRGFCFSDPFCGGVAAPSRGVGQRHAAASLQKSRLRAFGSKPILNDITIEDGTNLINPLYFKPIQGKSPLF